MKELKNLLQVRKLIALYLTAIFGILAFTGVVSPEDFKLVFVMVISFYFGKYVQT